ncbi:MAG TPA: HAD-IA family hydrolase [Candidatus Saccharimonadales bacterium]|jgi:FMN phosphatase YigB (HAD superfamily)/DNA-binding XRE family transcriptional regulator
MDEKGLGQRLQEARRAAGLTQQTLCQKANISYSTLAKIERGAIKAPSIFTIQNLVGALGITLDALMGTPATASPDSAGPALSTRSKNGIKFVYFDVNGCLVHFFQRAFTCLARETGMSADTIETYFWRYNDAVCRGQMSITDFNAEFASCLHVTSIDWQDYYLGAVEAVPDMHKLVRWAAENYRIGLLTNIMPGFLDTLLARELIPGIEYDVIIDSSVVGVIKPEAAIFELAQARAAVEPGEILLIDDDRSNIMIADKLGWHVLWCDDYHPEDTASRARQALEMIS